MGVSRRDFVRVAPGRPRARSAPRCSGRPQRGAGAARRSTRAEATDMASSRRQASGPGRSTARSCLRRRTWAGPGAGDRRSLDRGAAGRDRAWDDGGRLDLQRPRAGPDPERHRGRRAPSAAPEPRRAAPQPPPARPARCGTGWLAARAARGRDDLSPPRRAVRGASLPLRRDAGGGAPVPRPLRHAHRGSAGRAAAGARGGAGALGVRRGRGRAATSSTAGTAWRASSSGIRSRCR